jgi:hypothetical protein
MPHLRRVDCSRPGIVRRRAGRGFVYEQFGKGRVTDPETLQRIAGLAIPPAWKDVWICPYPNGHIQATGVDAAGRRQYRYHDDWRTRRDGQKFDRMLEFGKALPAMRERVFADLRGDRLTRERVLACAVRLLDLGLLPDRHRDLRRAQQHVRARDDAPGARAGHPRRDDPLRLHRQERQAPSGRDGRSRGGRGGPGTEASAQRVA